MSIDVYTPIRGKINSWIWYEDNKPKSKYDDNSREHDKFRSEHDLDCVLTDGNLYADTIFSLWLPLRWTLVEINGYDCLNKLSNINDRHTFLKKIFRDDNLERMLPKDCPAVIKLSKLFSLGQTRANVMILPKRWMQFRGSKPYYDYVPYFLYECFANGNFSKGFNSDETLVKWIEDESLIMFFNGEIIRDNIRDLSESGDIKMGIPKNMNILLDNYIDILLKRTIELQH